MFNIDFTERGFGYGKFEDTHGEECSLQISSVMPHVWLGIDNPKKVDYKDPSTGEAKSYISGRMHLNREQVAELISHLQAWLDTGSLQLSEESAKIREKGRDRESLAAAINFALVNDEDEYDLTPAAYNWLADLKEMLDGQ